MTLRFQPCSLGTAKAIILTPDREDSTESRWNSETTGMVDMITPLIPTGGHVVDFGMGIGRVLKGLHERYPGAHYTGVDSSHSMRLLAKEYLQGDPVSILEDLSLLPSQSTDVVICCYVLQHVLSSDLSNVLDQLERILKSDGKLVLVNMKGRCVPFDTKLEKEAVDLDAAIEFIAADANTTMNAWYDDGINVVQLLKERFPHCVSLNPNPEFFSRLILDSHDFLVLSK